MTVAELIKRLENVENKDKEVLISHRDWEMFVALESHITDVRKEGLVLLISVV